MTDVPALDRRRNVQELDIFHRVAKALTSDLNLNSILQTIMEQVAEFFRPESWSLLMQDESTQELYFAIAVGDPEFSKRRLRMGEGIAGWVAWHGKPVIVPDVSKDSGIARYDQQPMNPKWHSVACLPLKSRERVLGVIQLINVPMEEFGESERFFLQALCDYAAIAIDNARAVERIQELTIIDDCTGLYNARHLYKTLETEIYRSNRFGFNFGVLFIDLDYFKQVNDNHGHIIGSKLLAEAGNAIKSNLRLVDVAFRYGGDEFVVLLPQTDKDGSLAAARRLLLMFRHTEFLHSEGLALVLQASIGVSCYPEDGRTGREVIRLADESMYLVKRETRNGIAVAQRGLVKLPG
jgi:diguanylate cyclase (GGDEF)-like protein